MSGTIAFDENGEKNDSGYVSVSGSQSVLANVTNAARNEPLQIIEYCCLCINKNIRTEATVFCKICGRFGRYFCDSCAGAHKEFTSHGDGQPLSSTDRRVTTVKDVCALCFTRTSSHVAATHACRACGEAGRYLCKHCVDDHILLNTNHSDRIFPLQGTRKSGTPKENAENTQSAPIQEQSEPSEGVDSGPVDSFDAPMKPAVSNQPHRKMAGPVTTRGVGKEGKNAKMESQQQTIDDLRKQIKTRDTEIELLRKRFVKDEATGVSVSQETPLSIMQDLVEKLQLEIKSLNKKLDRLSKQ